MEEDKLKLYQDNKNEWRWRLTAPNGQIIGASTEGYKQKQYCIDNARRIGINAAITKE